MHHHNPAFCHDATDTGIYCGTPAWTEPILRGLCRFSWRIRDRPSFLRNHGVAQAIVGQAVMAFDAPTIHGGVNTSPWSATRCLDLTRLIGCS